MAVYFMYGRYDADSIREISSDRTEKVEDTIRGNGGKLISMYVLLGDPDMVFIVEFDELKQAVQTSVTLSRLTGIAFQTTPAVSAKEFDRIASEE